MTDPIDIPVRIGLMWQALAERFEDQSKGVDVLNDAQSAIQMALCAEACFWKASGDGASHDIKDVLPIIAPATPSIETADRH